MTRLARAIGETLHTGAQHVDTAGRVEVEEVDAAAPERPGGPAHRGGDVVQLQVREHPEALVPQGIEGGGTGLGVELEAHLGHAEPRLDPLGHGDGGIEIADVEREREMVARFVVHISSTSASRCVCSCPVRSRTRPTS